MRFFILFFLKKKKIEEESQNKVNVITYSIKLISWSNQYIKIFFVFIYLSIHKHKKIFIYKSNQS